MRVRVNAMKGTVVTAVLLVAQAASAQGLSGLGPPGGLAKVDPKAMAFETELLQKINALRQKSRAEPLQMDTRLRGFIRAEAEKAAKGDPSTRTIADRIKKRGMAPYGHYYQFVFGKAANEVLRNLRKDKTTAKALVDEFAKVGIGAFWVPVDKPYFQVGIILTRVPDARAGKPGLSRSETDPIMHAALPRVTECYNKALKERDPNLSGQAVFKIVIGGTGMVDDVSLLKSLGDAGFDGCALAVVKGLKFPEPYKGKPVTLNHPIRLSPPHGTRRLGRLTRTQIDSAFKRARHDFRNCYDARVKAKPDLNGEVTLSLTVKTNGIPTKIRITHDTTGDDPLKLCITERAKQVRFSPPQYSGEVDLDYPLVFEPHRRKK